MRLPVPAVVLLTGICVAVATPAASAKVQVDAGAEWQGEQLISWAGVDVAGTPAQAFAVLSDYDRMSEFLPGMVLSRVVSRDGTAVVIEQEADEGVLFLKQRLKVRMSVVETAPRQLSVRSLSGSFQSFEGTYQLTPIVAAPGEPQTTPHTRIEYRARFVPDFDLPRMIGPYVIKRSLERHLAAISGEIDRRAGGLRKP